MPLKDRLEYNAYQSKYYHANRERCGAFSSEWTKMNREKVNKARHKSDLKYKEMILAHYGGGVLACVRCGYSDIDCLCIDHINGGGTQHIKEIGGGTFLYHWLENNGFPKEYQTLCMNCNWKKRVINNECKRGGGNGIIASA